MEINSETRNKIDDLKAWIRNQYEQLKTRSFAESMKRKSTVPPQAEELIVDMYRCLLSAASSWEDTTHNAKKFHDRMNELGIHVSYRNYEEGN